MASFSSLEELRKIVQKDSDTRLSNELRIGQDVLGENAIAKLSRIQLIAHVVALRAMLEQSTAVKSLVSNYDPSRAEALLLEWEEGVKVQEEKGVGATAQAVGGEGAP